MSENKGIPIPSVVRGAILEKTAVKYSPDTGKRKAGYRVREGVETALSKIDQLHLRAERTLNSFALLHNGKDEKQPGWSMIRKYTVAGNGFLFATDPIAPDSIIVEHLHNQKTGKKKTIYHWVSDQVNPLNGLPFLYRLGSDGVIQEPTSHLKPDQVAEKANTRFICGVDGGMRKAKIEIWKSGKPTAEKVPTRRPIRPPRMKAYGKLSPQPSPI